MDSFLQLLDLRYDKKYSLRRHKYNKNISREEQSFKAESMKLLWLCSIF